MIVRADGVYGTVTKSEGESTVFKCCSFGSLIERPFGKVAVAICYDSYRKDFYENIKEKQISLILFLRGAYDDLAKTYEEIKINDYFCGYIPRYSVFQWYM